MLNIREIDVHYGLIQALHSVSLSVDEGEIVTLVGANGAGKSTTLNTISGLLRPTRGSIEFEGDDITRTPPHVLVQRGIVQVPEGRRIFAEMSVDENLELGAFVRRDRRAIARDKERLYEMFPRLAERRSQLGGTLSGGEQQMLSIARALMAAPRLLLLDEPSLGLAPLIVRDIFEVITAIRQQGVTLLLVEQNAHMALSIADRGYVLEAGRVVLAGDGRELMDSDMVRQAYLGENGG